MPTFDDSCFGGAGKKSFVRMSVTAKPGLCLSLETAGIISIMLVVVLVAATVDFVAMVMAVRLALDTFENFSPIGATLASTRFIAFGTRSGRRIVRKRRYVRVSGEFAIGCFLVYATIHC